jgi:hypothetical protein
MTEEPLPLTALEAIRADMTVRIGGDMPIGPKTRMVNFERGAPDGDHLGLPGVPKLSAEKWGS